MHSYSFIKSRISVPDVGAQGPKHVGIIDDIIKVFFVFFHNT